MTDSNYGRGLYFFVGLSTDPLAPTQPPAYATGPVPLVGQLAYETDSSSEWIWSGTKWLQKSTDGRAHVLPQSTGGIISHASLTLDGTSQSLPTIPAGAGAVLMQLVDATGVAFLRFDGTAAVLNTGYRLDNVTDDQEAERMITGVVSNIRIIGTNTHVVLLTYYNA